MRGISETALSCALLLQHANGRVMSRSLPSLPEVHPIKANRSIGRRDLSIFANFYSTTGEWPWQVVDWYTQQMDNGYLHTDVEHIPMLYNDSPDLASWTATATASIEGGTTVLMAFNQPDVTEANGGSNYMSVDTAVETWMTYMEPFAGKAQLLSPYINVATDSGLAWLEEFVAQCANCTIDAINIQWYGTSWSDVVTVESALESAAMIADGRSIWVNGLGLDKADISRYSESDIVGALKTGIEWLNAHAGIARYAYLWSSQNYLAGISSSGVAYFVVAYNQYVADTWAPYSSGSSNSSANSTRAANSTTPSFSTTATSGFAAVNASASFASNPTGTSPLQMASVSTSLILSNGTTTSASPSASVTVASPSSILNSSVLPWSSSSSVPTSGSLAGINSTNSSASITSIPPSATLNSSISSSLSPTPFSMSSSVESINSANSSTAFASTLSSSTVSSSISAASSSTPLPVSDTLDTMNSTSTAATTLQSSTSATDLASSTSAASSANLTLGSDFQTPASVTDLPSSSSATNLAHSTSMSDLQTSSKSTDMPASTSTSDSPTSTSTTDLSTSISVTDVSSSTSAADMANSTSATGSQTSTTATDLPSSSLVTDSPSSTSATELLSSTSNVAKGTLSSVSTTTSQHAIATGLTILSVYYATENITTQAQSSFMQDGSMTIDTSTLNSIAGGDPLAGVTKTLAVLYTYYNSTRIFTAKENTGVYTIAASSDITSPSAEVPDVAVPANNPIDIVAVVWGGKSIETTSVWNQIYGQAESGWGFQIGDDLFGVDPMWGTEKTCVIWYTEEGELKALSVVEGTWVMI